MLRIPRGDATSRRRHLRLAGVRALLLALCVVFAASAAAGPSHAVRAQPFVAPADEATSVAVRALYPVELDALASSLEARGYRVAARIDALSVLRAVPHPGLSLDAAASDLGATAGVEYAEPAYRLTRSDVPADPVYAKEATYLGVEKAPQAWDVEKGTAGVIVAVVDTGIDLTHPDLQGRIWTNPRETAGNAVDDDNNGCIDDVHGCGFVSDPSPGCQQALNGAVTDDVGHGTFVSGIIAANGNGAGMVGIARGVTILPVKVLDCQGGADAIQVAQGLLYAARAGARIINVSLGGPHDSAILREAARVVHDTYGALIVAASGNSGGEGVSYPAPYPGMLAVGAASGSSPDRRATFSTTGPEVAVAAIGENIVGTVPAKSCGAFLPCINGDPYAVGSGTSFAAPQVTALAALAALVLSHHPGVKPDALSRAIRSTAAAVPPGDRPDWAGAGRIDMFAAVTAQPGFRLGTPGVSRN